MQVTGRSTPETTKVSQIRLQKSAHLETVQVVGNLERNGIFPLIVIRIRVIKFISPLNVCFSLSAEKHNTLIFVSDAYWPLAVAVPAINIQLPEF